MEGTSLGTTSVGVCPLTLSLSLSYLSRIEIHLLTGFPSLQVLLLHEIKIFERVWFAAYGERYLYIYIG